MNEDEEMEKQAIFLCKYQSIRSIYCTVLCIYLCVFNLMQCVLFYVFNFVAIKLQMYKNNNLP